jgi:hypothetical protein
MLFFSPRISEQQRCRLYWQHLWTQKQVLWIKVSECHGKTRVLISTFWQSRHMYCRRNSTCGRRYKTKVCAQFYILHHNCRNWSERSGIRAKEFKLFPIYILAFLVGHLRWQQKRLKQDHDTITVNLQVRMI